MSSATTPQFTPRHVALGRAAAAAIAAIMITFSGDHSAALGLSVFSGFAVMTALVWVLAAWLVVPSGQRTTPIALALITGVVGIVAGGSERTSALLVWLIVGWALVTGVLELIQGLRTRGADRVIARDQITVGALTILLAGITAFLPLIPDQPYFIEEAGQSYTLTSTIIVVGVFGGYAAILAVYLAIVGFSPAAVTTATDDDAIASGKGQS